MDLDATELAEVHGGSDYNYTDADFGRCGPDSRWQFLGNYYTDACAAHDAAVRGGLEAGESRLRAHWDALPLFPAAFKSYFKARWG